MIFPEVPDSTLTTDFTYVPDFPDSTRGYAGCLHTVYFREVTPQGLSPARCYVCGAPYKHERESPETD